jgi:hypothetical protein
MMLPLPRLSRSRRLRLVVFGFIDDSGDFGGVGFFCLAGYIALDAGWDAFVPEWRRLLAKHKLDVLKTSDFLTGEGIYRARKESYDQRAEIVRQFVGCVRKHVLCGFAVGVDGRAYRDILEPYPKHVAAAPFCLERLLSRVHRRVVEWEMDDEPVRMTFDDSEKDSPKLYVASISFADDRFFLPLQAADLLGCAITQERRKGAGGWGPESPFHMLPFSAEDPTYGIPFVQEYWDAMEIEARKDELIAIATGPAVTSPGRSS